MEGISGACWSSKGNSSIEHSKRCSGSHCRLYMTLAERTSLKESPNYHGALNLERYLQDVEGIRSTSVKTFLIVSRHRFGPRLQNTLPSFLPLLESEIFHAFKADFQHESYECF